MELAIIIVGGIASLIVLAITIIVVSFFCSKGINSQSFIFPIIGLTTLGLNGALYYFALMHAHIETIFIYGIPALLLAIAVASVMFFSSIQNISTGILLLLPTLALFILALVQ